MFEHPDVRSFVFEWEVVDSNPELIAVVETALETQPTAPGFDNDKLVAMVNAIGEEFTRRGLYFKRIWIRGAQRREA